MRVPLWTILLLGSTVPLPAQSARCPGWPEYGSARGLYRATNLHLERTCELPERRTVNHLVFAAGGGYLVWATDDGLHSLDLRRGGRRDLPIEVAGLVSGRRPGRVLAVLGDSVCSVDARDLSVILLRQMDPRDRDDLAKLRCHPELLLAWTKTPGALRELGGDDLPRLRSVVREYPAFWAASIAAREVLVHPSERWVAIAGNTYSWCGTCARNARFSVFAADGLELYRGGCSGTRSSVDATPDGAVLAWADGLRVKLVRTSDWAEVGEAKGCFCWWRFLDTTTAIACDGLELSLWYVPTLKVVERRAVACAQPLPGRRWPRDFWANAPSGLSSVPGTFALSAERNQVALQRAGRLEVLRVRPER